MRARRTSDNCRSVDRKRATRTTMENRENLSEQLAGIPASIEATRAISPSESLQFLLFSLFIRNYRGEREMFFHSHLLGLFLLFHSFVESRQSLDSRTWLLSSK